LIRLTLFSYQISFILIQCTKKNKKEEEEEEEKIAIIINASLNFVVKLKLGSNLKII
jgi:hypothetical protein